MTINNNTTENAATLNAAAAWPVQYEQMTVGEYLDRVETGEIANPEFQSGQRWTEKQRARLVECLIAGRPVPPMIFARIPTTDGEPLTLRVDGNQRNGAILWAVERFAEDGEEPDAEKLEALKAARIDAQTVDAPNLMEAARLFIDLNNGTALSAIQRNKAQLSPSMMGYVNAYQDALTAARPGEKWGKVNADTAAAMLAAAAVKPTDAATSSASAVKVLSAVKDAPEFNASHVSMLMDAVRLLAAGDAHKDAQAAAARAAALEGDALGAIDTSAPVKYGNKGMKELSYWTSPAHLVPVWVYVCLHGEDCTAEGLADCMRAFDPAAKIRYSYTKKSGKTSKRVGTSIQAAFGDTSNAKTATLARICGFNAFANSYFAQDADITPQAVEDDAQTAQAVEDTAAVLAAALK